MRSQFVGRFRQSSRALAAQSKKERCARGIHCRPGAQKINGLKFTASGSLIRLMHDFTNGVKSYHRHGPFIAARVCRRFQHVGIPVQPGLRLARAVSAQPRRHNTPCAPAMLLAAPLLVPCCAHLGRIRRRYAKVAVRIRNMFHFWLCLSVKFERTSKSPYNSPLLQASGG
jgi:hypothetical protein